MLFPNSYAVLNLPSEEFVLYKGPYRHPTSCTSCTGGQSPTSTGAIIHGLKDSPHTYTGGDGATLGDGRPHAPQDEDNPPLATGAPHRDGDSPGLGDSPPLPTGAPRRDATVLDPGIVPPHRTGTMTVSTGTPHRDGDSPRLRTGTVTTPCSGQPLSTGRRADFRKGQAPLPTTP